MKKMCKGCIHRLDAYPYCDQEQRVQMIYELGRTWWSEITNKDWDRDDIRCEWYEKEQSLDNR